MSNSTSSSSSSGTFVLYHYTPSMPLAVIAIGAFLVLAVLHTWKMIKTRTWFMTSFIIGGIFEAAGYVGRALGHSDPTKIMYYVLQSVLILVAPALFAASIYMTLGRLMRATHGESYSLIRVTWLTKIFVVGDVFSFFVQSSGGGMMASGDGSHASLGKNIILAGLFIQIIMFGFFVVCSTIWHSRMNKYGFNSSTARDVPWLKMLYILYTMSAVIMVRSVYRVIEYVGGTDGSLMVHEWPVYVFDALLMILTMVIFFIGHPSMFTQGVGGFHLAGDDGSQVGLSGIVTQPLAKNDVRDSSPEPYREQYGNQYPNQQYGNQPQRQQYPEQYSNQYGR